MTEREHHLLCLGLLVTIWRRSDGPELHSNQRFMLYWQDKEAIEQAIESAEALGLPVSAKNLRSGLPVCKNSEN